MEPVISNETEGVKGVRPHDRSFLDRPYQGISAATLVDEKISDIVRMVIATAVIVLESDGCEQRYVERMKIRVARMLGVQERRSYGAKEEIR